MNHREASEVIAGQVLFGGRDAHSVNPGIMFPPYDKIVYDVQQGKEVETLLTTYGYSIVQAAEDAYSATKDSSNINWLQIVEEKAINADLGFRLSKIAKQLEQGKEVDVGKVLGLIQNMADSRMDFVTMDTVEPEKELWLPTFYPPIDEHMGGYIKGGMTVIGATPGSGKTSLMLQLAIGAAAQGKEVGIFSLEMSLSQLARRMEDIYNHLTDDIKKYIIASEEVSGVDEVYAKATRLKANNPNLYAVFIDFADLMVDQEQSEPVMGRIYIKLSVLAKRIGVPVILLAQLSRNYVGGEPYVHHLRYSGLAESMASTIWLLYNPGKLWANQGQFQKKPRLKPLPGFAYIIFGKSRYGYVHGGVGAVRVNWEKTGGWGMDNVTWQGLNAV